MYSSRRWLDRIRTLRLIPVRRPRTISQNLYRFILGFRIRVIGEPRVVSLEERTRIAEMPKAGFYAVQKGRVPGIYTTWAETLDQVSGFSDAKYKKFPTQQLAQAFIDEANSVDPYPTSTPGSSRSTNGNGTAKPDLSVPVTQSSSQTEIDHEVWPDIRDLPPHLQDLAKRGYKFASSSPSPNNVNGSYRLVVYCDGSGLSNGKFGARAGLGVWWGSTGEAAAKNLAERVPGEAQTNNRGELLAVIRALETCPYPDLSLEIRTDSQYTIKCMTVYLPKWLSNNFKLSSKSSNSSKSKYQNPYSNTYSTGQESSKKNEVKNIDLIKHLLVLLRRRGGKNGATFRYVKGHAGFEGNEGADRLAKMGAEMPARPDRLDWLDPEMEMENGQLLSAGGEIEPMDIDFMLDDGIMMTQEELEEFEKDLI